MKIHAMDGHMSDIGDLRAALDASGVVGTWDWDHTKGVVVYDEGGAKLLTGDPTLAERGLSGAVASAMVHPDDHEWLLQHMADAVRAGGLILAEYRVMSHDGQVRWLLSRGRTYLDEMGRPQHSRGILIDITETHDADRGHVTRLNAGIDDPLEVAASHCIIARQSLVSVEPSLLHMLLDMTLFEIGRTIARQLIVDPSDVHH